MQADDMESEQDPLEEFERRRPIRALIEDDRKITIGHLCLIWIRLE